MKYEYKIITPMYTDGKINIGNTIEQVKGFLNKEKSIYKDILINEEDWLNIKGQEGWELVNVIHTGVYNDTKKFYFKKIKP